MKKFNLQLISPEGSKFDREIEEAILPTPDGQVAVLADHMPLISLLSAGEIIIKENGKEDILVTEGGVVEVNNNKVRIIADSAEDLDSLDQLKIEQAKEHAEEILSNAADEIDYVEALALLEKQITKINILKRRKKYKG